MNIDLVRFTNRASSSSSRLVVKSEDAHKGPAVVKEDLSLRLRINSWRNGESFRYGTSEHQRKNVETKKAFYRALKESYGAVNADAGVGKVAVGIFWTSEDLDDWLENSKPLTARDVKRINTLTENSKNFLKEKWLRVGMGGMAHEREDGILHKAYSKFAIKNLDCSVEMPRELQFSAVRVLALHPDRGRKYLNVDIALQILEPLFESHMKQCLSASADGRSSDLLKHIRDFNGVKRSPGSRLVLEESRNGEIAGLCWKSLSLVSRIKAFFMGGSFWHGTKQDQKENIETKKLFHQALLRNYGFELAKSVYEKSGLNDDWINGPRPLTSAVAEIARECCRQQDIKLKQILNNYLIHELPRLCEAEAKKSVAPKLRGKELIGIRNAVEEAVMGEKNYGAMDWQAIDRLAKEEIKKYLQSRVSATSPQPGEVMAFKEDSSGGAARSGAGNDNAGTS